MSLGAWRVPAVDASAAQCRGLTHDLVRVQPRCYHKVSRVRSNAKWIYLYNIYHEKQSITKSSSTQTCVLEMELTILVYHINICLYMQSTKFFFIISISVQGVAQCPWTVLFLSVVFLFRYVSIICSLKYNNGESFN